MSKIKGVIWVKEGKKKTKTKMYLYDIFSTKQDAIYIAQLYKKKEKSKYYIKEFENNFWFPHKMYALYLNNIATKASLKTFTIITTAIIILLSIGFWTVQINNQEDKEWCLKQGYEHIKMKPTEENLCATEIGWNNKTGKYEYEYYPIKR